MRAGRGGARGATTGEVLEVSAPGDMDREAKGLFQALVLTLHPRLPATARPEWRTTERDPIGTFEATYRLDPVGAGRGFLAIEKRIDRYVAFEGVEVGGGRSGVDSVDRYRFDREQGLVEEARRDGRYAFGLDEAGIVLSWRFSRHLRLRDRIEDPALAEGGRRLLASLREGQRDAGVGSIEARRVSAREVDRSIEGRSIESVFEALETLEREGRAQEPAAVGELHRTLVAFFLVEEGTIDEALARVFDPAGPRGLRLWILDALGTAGTPRAQAALARAIESPALDFETRNRGLTSIVQLEGSTGELQEAVRRISEDRRDRDLSNQAILLLGGLARPSRPGEPVRVPALVRYLQARFERTLDRGERIAVLEALGNAGDPGSVDFLRGPLSDGDERVRSAAVTGLRQIATAPAVELLVDLALRDESPSVRTEAIFALSGRRSEEALRALVDRARGDAAGAVRSAAVRALEPSVDREDVRRALRSIAREDEQDSVREEAFRILDRS